VDSSEVKNMSQKNAEAMRPKACKPLSENCPEVCMVAVEKSSRLEVPLQKRKEEAKQTLYLNRV